MMMLNRVLSADVRSRRRHAASAILDARRSERGSAASSLPDVHSRWTEALHAASSVGARRTVRKAALRRIVAIDGLIKGSHRSPLIWAHVQRLSRYGVRKSRPTVWANGIAVWAFQDEGPEWIVAEGHDPNIVLGWDVYDEAQFEDAYGDEWTPGDVAVTEAFDWALDERRHRRDDLFDRWSEEVV